MGSILVNNVRNVRRPANKNYTYTDLHLDVAGAAATIDVNGRVINGKDIRADYDVDAIFNSLTNIFNTIPGERFLIPTFGCNIRRYLFDPITEYTARRIGNEIKRAIDTWEPRVTLELVRVVGKPEEHTYEVTISMIINDIRKTVEMVGVISTDSYEFSDYSGSCPTR